MKVRHATDDGTGVAASAATVTTCEFPIELNPFSVTNPIGITAVAYSGQLHAFIETAGKGGDIAAEAGKIIATAFDLLRKPDGAN